MVRSRKPAVEKKSRYIQIRVTDEQRRTLIEAATDAGLELSSWIRSVALKEARRVGVK